MAHLIPHPLHRLVGRLLQDLERGGAVLDLPASKIVRGLPGRDLSIAVHGQVASSPLG
ncbi:MAG: hypothetical protein H6Q89_4295, partial [Myxococcaceae bacterium]|nr:hypothetical protein [Myxococcaceae bacterium]